MENRIYFDLQMFNDDIDSTDEKITETTTTTEQNTTSEKTQQENILAQNQKEEKKKEEESPKPNAPEVYADWTAPEGIKFDRESGAKFSELARELDLSQEQGQKLVDLYSSMVQAQSQADYNLKESWYNESVKQYKQEEISVANKALHRFADQELIDLLKQTGFSNHPKVVGLFKLIGDQISEAPFAEGGNSAIPRTAAEILYPSMQKAT